MLYREIGNTGDMASILGYGCMRFPRSGGRVDMARAERQVISAIERGVNYFDTAYIYPGSEAAIGEILSKGLRDKVMLATKMPPMQINSQKDMEKMLDTQLRRLKTDHIDYYLLHMLLTFGGWERMKRLGVEEFFENARKSGKIRRSAFSFHGSKDQFIRISDDYTWDMCLLQYNYVDEFNQAGRAGVEYAAERGVGVVVMEPLRGGRLVDGLPQGVTDIFRQTGKDRTPAEWALRWVWDTPGVATLLSGMNVEEHIDENIRIACEATPNSLTVTEKEMFIKVREMIAETVKVPCTGCGYCVPCPKGVNIPLCFSELNDLYIFQKKGQKFQYLARTTGIDGGARSGASLCSSCGACEKKCPQGLPIRKHLKTVEKELENGVYKPAAAVIKAYLGARRRLKREKTGN